MTPTEFLARPTTRYLDFFGNGDSHADYLKAVGDGPPPDEVYETGNMMLLLIWPDRIVCTGYDGGEYRQAFEFVREPQEAPASAQQAAGE